MCIGCYKIQLMRKVAYWSRTEPVTIITSHCVGIVCSHSLVSIVLGALQRSVSSSQASLLLAQSWPAPYIDVCGSEYCITNSYEMQLNRKMSFSPSRIEPAVSKSLHNGLHQTFLFYLTWAYVLFLIVYNEPCKYNIFCNIMALWWDIMTTTSFSIIMFQYKLMAPW